MCHREMAIVTVLSLFVGLAASVLLIPSLGLTGAAIANIVALLTRGITATAFLYLRTGQWITILHAWRAN
jgi:O-antigen/teichoic acid export membrane protein